MNKKPKIIIATPGRLKELIFKEKIGYLNYLAMIDFLIFDEIDRIIELGLFQDLTKIFKYLSKDLMTSIKKEIVEDDMKDIRDEVTYNGVNLKVFDENEEQEENAFTPKEISYAKFC